MIEFRDIQVKFGDFVAIEHLDLEVNENEFFTLLGASGSGKSTTLNTLSGFIEPSHGQIFLDGKDITKQPVQKREVGMVFQNYALFPSLNIYENIAFGLRIQKKDKQTIDDRVKSLAKMVALDVDKLDKNISELSGGQQQRVAIARGLAQEPKILLLDEPLSNLDAKLRKQLRRDLKSIQNQYHITMIYVTHDQDEALSLSDRLAVFNNGKIEQVGTPMELYNNPATEYVNNFLGESNVIEKPLIEEINSQTGSQLNPDKVGYIREERVTNVVRNDDKHAQVEATLEDYEFLGSTIRFTFDYKGNKLKTFEKSDSIQQDVDLSKGSQHTLYMNPANIKQFD
ncbi:ABC transporter ATP-binding protein [Staphylococcus auricularis]|uniref:Carnitine transport ATP-binding protein OpuCA n=1 Tax=Staphylococcus auricularis TaxID=29379 RepID=A0AAP8PNK4_9STAP|nr:ABC transporter ATP-binding protein [Staphylococcus auricularis]MDC6327272.1 ABC transporter ATP-binding protein [Staphylococcus auricularis]MDN4533014.1 ABC transporter ATP-binding protein [Staphylococcus auricularis]PNZ67099.1 ABC transporter ATP-binding protein [Staphylococcus auricularis]QPT06092.1 ABC transporter ATP-binding protein [Staphylococcus auricularis]SQJ06461.1 spermidine:putrescine ABC transporter ATP-binding protein [Staphylococcus auricularis]